MRPSNRHAVPLLALSWLASLAVLHGMLRPVVETCADPAALRRAGEIAGATSLTQLPPHRGSSPLLQWTSGLLADPTSVHRALEFRVVRSARPPELYREATEFAPRASDVIGFPVERVDLETPDGTLPLRMVRPQSERRESWIVGYLFVREGRPVESPAREQIVSPLRGEPRVPLTLYLASAVAPEHQSERAESAVSGWLAAAWEHHRRVCSP